jgi:hypothetical protein
MKYLNIILTIIAILLLSASLHLIQIKALLTALNQNYQLVIQSNQAIITVNQRLENSFSELSKQIEKVDDKLLKN